MAVYVSDLFTATPAPVDANPTATRTFQWLRGSTAISGATSSTYTAVTADIGSSLSTTQFETNFLSSVTATSASTEVVQAFDPIRLFSSSEPGVWYDPNDAANLDWRRNLLLQTDQFESSTWTKLATTVTANAAAAPDGTMTADKIIASAASGEHGIYQTTSGTTGTVYVVAKAAEYTNLRMGELGNYWFYASFDLITGVVSGTGGPRFSSAYMVSLGDGWWQCVIKHTSVGTVPFTFGGFPTGATGFALANFTGNGTSGVFVAQSQAEQGTVATEYQPITDLNTEVIARFPNATLYQDTTGTAPVTTPGQTVALMLDKSRGGIGPELVTNGDFSGGTTGWAFDAGWTISGGAATATSVTSKTIYQTVSNIVAGRTYRVSYNATGATVNAIRINIRTPGDNFQTDYINLNGTVVVNFTSTVSGTMGLFCFASGVTIDNISVKELPGLHATQPTLASRPTYGIVPTGGRRNLLTFSDQFDNAAWVKAALTVSANAGAAPDGTTTADKIVPDTTNSFRYANGAPNYVAATGQSVVHSCYVKADGYNKIALRESAVTGAYASFDIATVSLIEAANGGSVVVSNPIIVSVGSGWFRISMTCTNSSTTQTNGFGVWPLSPAYTTGNPTQAWTGNGTSGILVWGAQLETGSTATAYQKVTTQYDVTEAGVPSLGYLFFDGVNDWMVTPTITPGTDKVQVFAGVRKLSDAAAAVIAETSANSDTNAGSTYLVASVTSGNYQYQSGGTTRVAAAVSGYVAPITNVITGLGDIAGDLTTMRINGTQVVQSTSDQGTGNYLAYPMYIGRRGGTALPFNGHLFPLIVRFGPNLTTARIAATETWVASKTAGVTL